MYMSELRTSCLFAILFLGAYFGISSSHGVLREKNLEKSYSDTADVDRLMGICAKRCDVSEVFVHYDALHRTFICTCHQGDLVGDQTPIY
jgi:hypothetical protein